MVPRYFKLQRRIPSQLFWFIIVFIFCIPFQISPGTAEETRTMAIVLRSQQIAAYNDVIKGFEDGCKGNGISIKAIYDLKGDVGEGKRVMVNIKNDHIRPDVVFAVGVLAATLAKEYFPHTPIIFCMVINHERFDLDGPNITGISSEASVEDQFSILKELLGTRKNIGVIYDPTKTKRIITEATVVAKTYEFNLVTAEVMSENDINSTLDRILKKIDALWIVPDSTVITKNSLGTILQASQKCRLPTICTSVAIVKGGALVSISPDYLYTGVQAAKLAQTLLRTPTRTSLGIQQPDKLKIVINTQAAKTIGTNLSSLQSRTDVVFYP
ncbi:MAG: ABC transporter substrate binding protein [Candidatus Brocadiaceae bacterium]